MNEHRKEVISWCLFDVANSSYTTVIITVSFGVIFSKFIVGSDVAQGNFLWSLALGLGWLACALISPFLGYVSDRAASKKRFLAGSVALCALPTAALYFANEGAVVLAMALVITSNVGFSLSENFISSFLPHITSRSNMAKVSGLAWGLGYLGGLGSILVCLWVTGLRYDPDNYEALRLTGPLTAGFFLIFALPTFLFVREPAPNKSPLEEGAVAGYRDLVKCFWDLKHFPDLRWFLTSFFFFQGGVSIVISFAALYGEQVIGLSGKMQAAFFISLQLTAAIGAVAFGYLQTVIGPLRTINLSLGVWVLTVLGIFFLQELGSLVGIEDPGITFLLIGNVAGLCLGATQSSARALVGLFSPPDKSGEFYGFWGFAGKLSQVFAILSFGAFQSLFNMHQALLVCAGFFLLGYGLNFKVDESRGLLKAEDT